MRRVAPSLLLRRASGARSLLPCSHHLASTRFQSGYPPMHDSATSSANNMFHDASMRNSTTPAAGGLRSTDSHMGSTAGGHSVVPPPTHSQTLSSAASHEQGQQQREETPRPQKPTTAPRFLKIHTNERNVVNIQLARAPVNSLSLEMLQELNPWLLWLGSNDESRAVVLSSAIPTVFSAGLDLAELSQTQQGQQQERFASFWQAYQETWLILNTFPKPLIAAITGNSPAAGCVLAMGCDYRVMARGPLQRGNSNSSHTAGSESASSAAATAVPRLYRIGLNETKLGLTTPAWVMPAYAYMLGSRQAERMLQLGETPTADEARAIGLVDHVEEDEDRTLEVAMQQAERFLAVPQPSRWMVRDMMRREYLQMLSSEEDRNYDTEFTTQLVASPEVQASLANYLDRLKGKVRK